MASDHRTAGAMRALLEGRLPQSARSWFSGAAAELDLNFDAGRFFAAFSAAGRRLGADVVGLADLSPELHLGAWGMDELGRATLLLQAVEAVAPSAAEDLVNECFSRGDNRERQAVLRALPLLPDPQRFLPTAIEACRSSVQPVFEAIACENPYPARHFPQHAFNQMVLKSVFTGVAVGRIVGLESRFDRDLARMAADYAQERRAAGRTVPADLELLMSCSGGAHEAL
jgi:hypothetical protein